MKYVSTRGNAPKLDYEQVLLTGLASDGGLYLPETLPVISSKQLKDWATLSYQELAFEIISMFTGNTIKSSVLQSIIENSYTKFQHPSIAPLVQLDNNLWIMELFRGPTLAFKDFAMQLLGRQLDHFLTKRQEHAVILAATSGDTGSAAIEGCRHSSVMDIFIMHPHNRVSEVQRRQMTTVMDDNVHNIAIKGNFDDCQALVKKSFKQQQFLKGNQRLVAVNSINWGRIVAQTVYYFSAALALREAQLPVTFVVPTGNFGDIYAGYIAKNMGLPIEKLIVATNENDIVHRFFSKNSYEKQKLVQTLSPSMDIMVSSNLERLLFNYHNENGSKIAELMADFEIHNKLTLDASIWKSLHNTFQSYRTSNKETVDVIQSVFKHGGYLLDPHTATAVNSAQNLNASIKKKSPVIVLATAHPVKFPEAIKQAHLPLPALPQDLKDLYDRQEKMHVLPNSIDNLHEWMTTALSNT